MTASNMPSGGAPGKLDSQTEALVWQYFARQGTQMPAPPRQPVPVPHGLGATVDFATRLANGGRITFGAIRPDAEGRFGATFDMPAGQSAACQFIAAQAQTANVYFVLNEAAPPAEQAGQNGCPRSIDIRMLRGVPLDVDSKLGPDATAEEHAAEQARLDAVAQECIAAGAAIVIHSGGGRQAIWLFPEPIPATAENIAAVSDQARGIAARFGGDAIHDPARLLRAPETMNWPDEGKRRRGRVPTMARLIHEDWSCRRTLTELATVAEPITGHGRDRAGQSADMAQAAEEIDFIEAELRDGLPAELTDWIREMRARDRSFASLIAGSCKTPGDGTGSAWRAALAGAFGRYGRSGQDYADFVLQWPPGASTKGIPLDERTVLRDWGRVGIPARRAKDPAGWFDVVAGDVDVSRFPAVTRSAPAAASIGSGPGRGLPAGVDPITEPPEARSIPIREFLIEPRLSPGTVTEYVGEPGVSKSTATIWDAIVIASGDERVLRGEGGVSPERLHRTGPVILYNAEDSQDEMRRRLAAALTFYGLTTLQHPIYLWSGLDHGPLIILKRERAHGPLLRGDGADRLVEAVRETGAVYVALDPLAKLATGTSENDTDDMNELTQVLARDAARLGTSIALVHHTAKHTRNVPGDQGAGRGAFSIVGGVRGIWTLCNLAPDDAKAWGLSARDHIRLDHAKANHGRKLEMPILLKRENVAVGNGRGREAVGPGRDLFDLTAREMLEFEGDRAPVLRVVGMGKPVTEEARAEKRAESDNLVAQVVLGVLGQPGAYQLSAVRERLSQALREAGFVRGQGREAIDKCLQAALAGEAQTGSLAGQDVRLQMRKDGLKPTAPWILLVETTSDKVNDAPLSTLSDSEIDNAYKTENTDLFD